MSTGHRSGAVPVARPLLLLCLISRPYTRPIAPVIELVHRPPNLQEKFISQHRSISRDEVGQNLRSTRLESRNSYYLDSRAFEIMFKFMCVAVA